MLVRSLPLVLIGALGACSLSVSGIGSSGGAGQGGATSGASSASSITSGGGMVPDSGWWDEAFSQRVRITFKNDGGEELTDFPVMVRLDASRIDYGAASPSGADLRFIDADGQTPLAHEIERWSPGGASVVWVRVPKIDKASGADHMWLYYGSPSAPDAQKASDVWTGFVGVYHLSPNVDAPQAVLDSTGVHPGAWYGKLGGASAGMIGDAADLDGFESVRVGDIDDFSVDPGEARTVEVWLNPKGSQEQYAVYQEGQCRGWYVGMNSDGSYEGHLSAATDTDVCGNYNEYKVTGTASPGVWHHVTLVVDRPALKMRLFIDGLPAEEKDIDNTADADGNGIFQIGTDWDNTNPFRGSIDEVRVSSSARSDGWIAAQHKSMTDAFLSFAGEPRP